MARFGDAIFWLSNGGIARRSCWAKVPAYTQTTPPMAYDRMWHIWQSDAGSRLGIVQGWGGQIGAASSDDPIRDGTYYSPSDEDRVATDWELLEKRR